MSNEMEWVYANQVILEASGASAASNAFAAADDATLSAATHGDYPLGDLVLNAAFGAGVGASVTVNLYRRDLDIDGTTDAPIPSATYKNLYVGSFLIESGASAAQSYPLPDVPLARACQFYIENATAQNLSAGWTLKVTPKTYAPGA